MTTSTNEIPNSGKSQRALNHEQRLALEALSRRLKRSKFRLLRLVLVSDGELHAYSEHRRHGIACFRVLRDERQRWHTHRMREKPNAKRAGAVHGTQCGHPGPLAAAPRLIAAQRPLQRRTGPSQPDTLGAPLISSGFGPLTASVVAVSCGRNMANYFRVR